MSGRTREILASEPRFGRKSGRIRCGVALLRQGLVFGNPTREFWSCAFWERSIVQHDNLRHHRKKSDGSGNDIAPQFASHEVAAAYSLGH